MSAMFKEWKRNKEVEALCDIDKIVKIFEDWHNNESGEGIVDGWFAIKDVLEDGDWIG